MYSLQEISSHKISSTHKITMRSKDQKIKRLKYFGCKNINFTFTYSNTIIR